MPSMQSRSYLQMSSIKIFVQNQGIDEPVGGHFYLELLE